MTESPNNFKAVLFDLDGTLIEFKFPVKESRRAMIDFLKRNGYQTDNLNDYMRTQDLFDDIQNQWYSSQKLAEMHTFPDLRESLFRILDDFEYDSHKESRPLRGCLDLIKKLNEAGIQTGLVTNSGRGSVISVLSDYGYLEYMEVVVTRNDMKRMKPRPDGLLEAMKLLQLGPEDLLYVGDSILDIEASRQAGIKCAVISSGLYSSDVLRQKNPDFILESIEDVAKIVLADRS